MAAPDVKPGAPGGRTEPFVGQKSTVVPNGSPKVTVYEIATGRSTDVWPVDARELVASGEYSRTAPAPAAAEPTPDPAALDPAAARAEPPADAPPAEPPTSEPTAPRRARAR